jgi:hypothetical protein
MLELLLAGVLTVDVPTRLTAYLDASEPIADAWSPPQQGATWRAMAKGRVESVDAGTVTIAHTFFENADRRTARFVVTGLESITVTAGQVVDRGQLLGTGRKAKAPMAAELLKIPSFNPLTAPRLFVVEVDARRLVAFEKGVPVASWDVGIGQAEGAKEVRGDLKTPRGLYFVTEHYQGKFAGSWADFYGGYWVKLSYPNAYDAARGVDAGLITQGQAADIDQRWRAKALPAQKTKLGGGIGFHSWAAEWSADAGTAMSFGCVVLHPADIDAFFGQIQLGDPVVLR